MRVLVAPHGLGIGGSQINAIDLAAAVAGTGHEVLVYGRPGPLVERIEAHGLEFVPARRLRYRPAPSRIAQLARLARRREIDLIHAYEWPPCLDAYYGAHLLGRTPLLCTVLSMSPSRYVPPSVPLVMGTVALGERAAWGHRAPVWALEPPVDTTLDSPRIDGAPLRRDLGLAAADPLIVTVSRLALELKLEALVDAVDAVGMLGAGAGPTLLVVGDGPAAASLRERAEHVNRTLGRKAIRFAGALADPRPAYAAADLVLGMGGSALRAMAIGKPVIVQGEAGFSRVFEPEGRHYFLRHGFWGVGDGRPNAERLAGQIRELIGDPERRARLAAFSRRTVARRFSMERATRVQVGIYNTVLDEAPGHSWSEAATAAARALRLELDNHDPRRKRERSADEAARLAATQNPGRAPGPTGIAATA